MKSLVLSLLLLAAAAAAAADREQHKEGDVRTVANELLIFELQFIHVNTLAFMSRNLRKLIICNKQNGERVRYYFHLITLSMASAYTL